MANVNVKKVAAFSAICLALAGLGWWFFADHQRANAAEPTPEKLQVVASRCATLKDRLSKLEGVEVAARIKRGRAYDTSLLPFVTTFNGRIAANQVDAPELIRLAAELQQSTSQAQFAQLYNTYATDLANARQSDCQANPALTYEWIEKARIDRAALAAQVKKIDEQIGAYIAELEKLEKRFIPVINAPAAEPAE